MYSNLCKIILLRRVNLRETPCKVTAARHTLADNTDRTKRDGAARRGGSAGRREPPANLRVCVVRTTDDVFVSEYKFEFNFKQVLFTPRVRVRAPTLRQFIITVIVVAFVGTAWVGTYLEDQISLVQWGLFYFYFYKVFRFFFLTAHICVPFAGTTERTRRKYSFIYFLANDGLLGQSSYYYNRFRSTRCAVFLLYTRCYN